LKKLLELLCGALAAAALFAIMVLTFLDVMGRKFLDRSITGSLEMTELLMVIVIFAALPLVSLRGEHVVFDSMDSYFTAAALRMQKAVVNLLIALMLLALGYLMWRTAGEFADSGETTAQLKFSKAPFIYGMAVLCALSGVIHLALMVRPPPELAEGEGAAL
jgi:TRAP-type transport system small permease protein